VKIFGREHGAAKQFVEGTHRVCSPRATLAAHAPKMKSMGITRLADVTGLDFIGLPVYMAVRPNSRGLAVSQGKGLDREAAKASALMESIEGWHAERIVAPLRHESYAALRRAARVVDVTRLPLERGATLELNTPRLWIEGYDLLAGEAAWVPFECVMTNFVRPAHAGRTFVASSNGLASGNHLLEAVTHALCEVIERDAATRWRRSTATERQPSQLDLATVEPPRCRAVLDQVRRAGIETVVWDATADTGVPTSGASSRARAPISRRRWPSCAR
jgi:YcaO-like protein with predicted kinase domain